jgi:hypothetical protein
MKNANKSMFLTISIFVIYLFFVTAQSVSAQESETVWRLKDTTGHYWSITVEMDSVDTSAEWHPVDKTISSTCETDCPLKLHEAFEKLTTYVKEAREDENEKLQLSRAEIIPLRFSSRNNKNWAYVFHFYDVEGRSGYAAVYEEEAGTKIIIADRQD